MTSLTMSKVCISLKLDCPKEKNNEGQLKRPASKPTKNGLNNKSVLIARPSYNTNWCFWTQIDGLIAEHMDKESRINSLDQSCSF